MPNRPITRKEREAWKFAKQAHKGQVRRFVGLPYFDAHVKKVNEIVKRYTTDEDLLCAAILHDVPEDCYDDYEVGLAEIENLFGSRVSKLVSELTSLKDEIDEVYEGDKAAYLTDKMIHMTDDALIIKLADRLQNISDAFTASERFRNKYFEETSKIVDVLERHRQFNKIQTILLNEIKAKLSNIGSIFRIKRFGDFDETP
jgi:(p)ppGpp synthase/HD superfamily hydrolase